MSKPDAKAFLAKLGAGSELDEAPQLRRLAQPEPLQTPREERTLTEIHQLPAPLPRPKRAGKASKPSRSELKHFGGYLEDATLEKIAILRVRLKKDNSELIKFAIEELHRRSTPSELSATRTLMLRRAGRRSLGMRGRALVGAANHSGAADRAEIGQLLRNRIAG